VGLIARGVECLEANRARSGKTRPGVRTLSAQNPTFNPYSYHRGSVWPVAQATFAIGFMRYGLHDHMEKICRAQFEVAACFDADRLPELFSGHARDELHPFP
jgi:glycogen debranching enzyme